MGYECEEIMDVKELKAKIISKEVPSFLVFHGDEWEVQKVFIQQMSKSMALPVRYIDSVTDIMKKLKSSTISGTADYIYVVRDDKALTTDEKVLARVRNSIGNSILILLLTKLDKRLKFYTGNKDSIIVFEALTEAELTKLINKEIPLSDDNIHKLIEVCDSNYGRIRLEIDKIKSYISGACRQYGKPCNVDIDEAFNYLLDVGVIYREPKDAIFDFVNAILDRKVNKAYALYEDCKAVNESTLAILTNLFNNVRYIMQVQMCTSKDVSKSTGLTGWQINNARKHLNVYSDKELGIILKLIQWCEKGIKTGQIEEQFVIDYILVRIL